MTKYLRDTELKDVRLSSGLGKHEILHVFEDAVVDAIDSALAARRPLLVRGEPGIGKSQLARAAAKALGRVVVSRVVNARTEPEDLLWTFDAVARLAEAQVLRAAGAEGKDIPGLLSARRFVEPGPLWWGLAFESARAQFALRRGLAYEKGRAVEGEPSAPKNWKPSDGAVVLIDEIDKADTSVPNGLLEALGDRGFDVPAVGRIDLSDGEPPLVVITTNEERALPDAFLRRCFVLHLRLDESDIVDFLIGRGSAHFPNDRIKKSVLKLAAERLAEARSAAREARSSALPGQAEYIDLLRALDELAPGSEKDQKKLIDRLKRYSFEKHVAEAPE